MPDRSAGPFVSIVIPTFRRPDRLLRALGSLLDQDLTEWEALVIDDGDGEGIAAARELDDERIRARPSAGTGQVDARSTAIGLASGTFICWLDDDDWWSDPEHLSLLCSAAHERRFFYRGGWMVHEDSGGAEIGRDAFDHEASARSLQRDNTILTSSIAYPRVAHRELGLLDRELGGYCDWDFMLRMCNAGFEPVKLPGLGVCYAIHDSNLSSDYDAPPRRRNFERFKAKHQLDVELANHERIHKMLTG
jgi:glycosyltransferase involved in cell wall biosynthesis